jgi:hypothetical protein
MLDRTDPHALDRLTLRFLDALDSGDLDTVAAIWQDAADDPELYAALVEVCEEVAREIDAVP